MPKFDSKSFSPKAFGLYINSIPSFAKNELARSRAVGSNQQARYALANQSGSLYARIPYYGRISADTSQNNDGASDIAASVSTTFEQGFITASRMDSWTEKSFSRNLTSGADFMSHVASQIADYKLAVKQAMLLAILAGVFSMNTSGSDIAAVAAKEFIEKHTYDISANSGEDALVGPATLNMAIQRACGDNKNIFRLVIMHSETASRLENLSLLKYFSQTDSDGIQRDLSLATWNGRTVLIDDNMPVSTDSGSPVYTSYVLGEGSVILDDIGDSNPYEMSRDPAKNGGQDTLFVRDRFICGVDGISFENNGSITASASNADLADGDNWNIINDGVSSIPHKSIAIARIISKG